MISVITPVFNADLFLDETIPSVLQHSQVSEYLLVDDGSTDQSMEILMKYSLIDDRIKILSHPNHQNLGRSASRNLGLSNASSEYISFLDADDLYLPNRFENTFKVFHRYPETFGVYECIGTRFDNYAAKLKYLQLGRPLHTTIHSSNIEPHMLLETLVMGGIGWFSIDGLTIRNEYKSNFTLFFDEEFELCQDTDWIWQCVNKKTFRPGNIQSPVAVRRVHGHNSILNKKKVIKYRKKLHKKWFEKIPEEKWNCNINTRLYWLYTTYDSLQQSYFIMKAGSKIIYRMWVYLRYNKLYSKIIRCSKK